MKNSVLKCSNSDNDKQASERLIIGHWNIEGIKSSTLGNKTQLAEVISTIKRHDIFGLTETHADENSVISVPDYIEFRTCRNKNSKAKKMSGGVAVLVKKNMAHSVTVIKSKHSDIIWLKISKTYMRLNRDLYVGFVYVSPSTSAYTRSLQQDTWDVLTDELLEHQRKGTCVLMGDFNARVGTDPDYIENDDARYNQTPINYMCDQNTITRANRDRNQNAYKHKLLEMCIASGLRILNGRTMGDCFGELTCHRRNGNSTIDLGLVDDSLLLKVESFKVGNFDSTLSDHCPITATIRLPVHRIIQTNSKSNTPAPIKPKWNPLIEQIYMQNIASTEFQQSLNNLAAESINGENVDQQLSKAVSLLCKAAAITPRAKNKFNRKRPKNKPWFNVECAASKLQLKEATKEFNRNPFNYHSRDTLFMLKKKYKRILRKHKRSYKNIMIEKLENMSNRNPKEYWSVLDELRNTEREEKPEVIDESEWLAHYSKLFSAPSAPQDTNKISEEMNRILSEPHFNELDYHITVKEIQDALNKAKLGKAVGIDNVSGEMLKCAAPILTPWLLKLFNEIFRQGIYPQQWCTGIITSIFKAGDPQDPNNYRGLTITSCLGKVYNIILNSRLEKYIEDKNIIPDNQIGFRKKARTSDHMFILKTLMEKYVTNKNSRPLYLCFVDFKKAYDSVWHEGLMLKLLHHNVRGLFFKSVQSMYRRSLACIKHQGCMSEKFRCGVGVRQGDVMSPLLFNLYISDLPQYIKASQDSPMLGDLAVNCLMYADDMLLISLSKSDLQIQTGCT